MSKHIWPFQPPQRLRINESVVNLPEFNNNDILQVESMAQVNVLIMLTPARVLVYNLRPMALVASHERTAESIAEFGPNKFLTRSHALEEAVEGLVSEEEVEKLIGHHGKIIFHVATEKNTLLTYQILKNSSDMATFKNYGIPVVDLAHLQDDEQQEYDENVDDDTLTIFEKDKSSKVIQNGYCVTKETGFLQFLTSSQDDTDELPIKKLELRLKVVLKFDYPVLDMIGFKRLSYTGDSRAEESLLLLFPHGLQQLTMIDFKLKDTCLIELIDGRKICIASGQVVVISQNEDFSTMVYRLGISNQKHKVTELQTGEKLLDCFEINGKVLLAFTQSIVYYDPVPDIIGGKWHVGSQIKVCGKLNNSTLLVITEAGSIKFYSAYGNLLSSTASDDDDSQGNDECQGYDYSDFTCVDKTLVIVTHGGEYELWDLWEELPQTFSDNRFQRAYALQSSNNDIAIYSPPIDTSTSQQFLNTIKLPTTTINNCVSLLKVNPTFKMLAVYVANKSVLLLQNLETNAWYCFKDIAIIDMHWLGSTYLVCHIKQEDCSHVVRCFRFPLQDLDTSEIAKYRLWEYELQFHEQLQSFHVNTAVRYRLLRVKARDGEEFDKFGEKFFRTADIVLVTNRQILVFAVISTMHWSGLNVIKKLYEQMRVEISLTDKIDWITNHKEGLMYLSRNRLIKVDKEDGSWRSQVVLCDVERIIDLIGDDIFLVQNQNVLIYRIEDLYESLPALLSVPIDEDFYPISLTPESATIHGLRCIFQPNYVKLVVKHKIYLDQMITAKIALGVSAQDIMMEYGSLRHYNFALEKILSTSILANESLDGVLPLVKICDNEGAATSGHNNMLEIVSNCLRKIETKHWNILFSKLQMTPKDLLVRCLEGKDAKILGVLLLVFLNYDKTDFMEDLRGGDDETVADVIKDQDMMLSVLRLLVTSAANATDSTIAADSWDMCFQLIRLLKALDKGNNTNLVQEALLMINPSSS
ncbi:hypothetical protein ZYGR_0AF02850 [Zygosaccharomyces rouxii]|uniref:RIC1 C-terminal alpha solenoid region domain-containing protein n=1 Tax=Zygosaccharomyces rouxii TaxID=4956 RepID=A0A1Q3A7V9_ZYGRO|nr:hypothetical protein ZYGR_0AF02850 [Zygosaccharomyces rouxii]